MAREKIQLCNKQDCTACKACFNSCNFNAIQFKEDDYGQIYPSILNESCVSCGQCVKVCPVLNPPKLNATKLVYAGWNLDSRSRSRSASGGIGAAIYRLALESHWYFSGVDFDGDFNAIQRLYDNGDSLDEIVNSKYVYSDMNNICLQIRNLLEHNETVIFIGTPCQVAAVKNFCKECNETLFTIDLICHGVAPTEYLKKHIIFLEKNRKTRASSLTFRDPKMYTYTYTFTLFDKLRRPIYSVRSNRDDYYQLGYHNALIYRENCYHCNYAQELRVGDLTIGDFNGVGKIKSCNYDNKKVSCILQNTLKGEFLLKKLVDNNLVYLENRPIKEAFEFENQLRQPSKPHENRTKFLKIYSKCGDFEKSAKLCLRKNAFLNNIKYYLQIEKLKSILVKILPQSVKRKIKSFMKN